MDKTTVEWAVFDAAEGVVRATRFHHALVWWNGGYDVETGEETNKWEVFDLRQLPNGFVEPRSDDEENGLYEACITSIAEDLDTVPVAKFITYKEAQEWAEKHLL